MTCSKNQPTTETEKPALTKPAPRSPIHIASQIDDEFTEDDVDDLLADASWHDKWSSYRLRDEFAAAVERETGVPNPSAKFFG